MRVLKTLTCLIAPFFSAAFAPHQPIRKSNRFVIPQYGLLVMESSGSARALDTYTYRPREGTLVSIIYRNPHVLLQLNEDDGTAYAATWDSATSLKHGDRV
jgi:hypothetical protein